MERDVRAGLTRRPQEPPARLLLRRPGQPALRRDHPAPRVLPDPVRAVHPRRPRRGHRRAARGRHPGGAGGRHLRRSHASCSTPCGPPGRCAASSPRRERHHAVEGGHGPGRRVPRCGRARAVVADFHHHLDRLPTDGPRLFAFLGGTIGNLDPAQRRSSSSSWPSHGHDDRLLLGTDLVKDRARLVAAYDDAAGVTAEFNRNVLLVLNRELGADFDPERFEHVARWNEADQRIEMRLRSSRRPDGPGRRPRPGCDVRRGRGAADRDQHQVHARGPGGPSSTSAASWWRPCGAPRGTSSC